MFDVLKFNGDVMQFCFKICHLMFSTRLITVHSSFDKITVTWDLKYFQGRQNPSLYIMYWQVSISYQAMKEGFTLNNILDDYRNTWNFLNVHFVPSYPKLRHRQTSSLVSLGSVIKPSRFTLIKCILGLSSFFSGLWKTKSTTFKMRT